MVTVLMSEIMKNSRSRHSLRTGALLFFISCMTAATAATAATAEDPPRDPTATIRALADKIYVLGETRPNAADMVAAEAQAGDEIRRYVASGRTEGLFVRRQGRQSPLLMAAYMGYPNVVAALLTSPLVREHMNDAEDMGLTPWIAANFSMRQSVWVCRPSFFSDPYSFVPTLVTQPYYLLNPNRPYKSTRMVLEEAGASSDEAQAKALWVTMCKDASEEVKARVQAGADLQDTVQELGARGLADQLKQLQKSAAEGRKR